MAHKAYINDKNCINISLAIATFFNSIAIIKLLLEQSININKLNYIDFTLLQLLYCYYTLSRVKNKLRILNLLLEHKVNSNKKISRKNILLIKIY